MNDSIQLLVTAKTIRYKLRSLSIYYKSFCSWCLFRNSTYISLCKLSLTVMILWKNDAGHQVGELILADQKNRCLPPWHFSHHTGLCCLNLVIACYLVPRCYIWCNKSLNPARINLHSAAVLLPYPTGLCCVYKIHQQTQTAVDSSISGVLELYLI